MCSTVESIADESVISEPCNESFTSYVIIEVYLVFMMSLSLLFSFLAVCVLIPTSIICASASVCAITRHALCMAKQSSVAGIGAREGYWPGHHLWQHSWSITWCVLWGIMARGTGM